MTSFALPRSVAARITVGSLAATQRVIAASGALVFALIVADVLIARGSTALVPIGVAPSLGIGLLALLLL